MAREMKDSGVEWLGKIPSSWQVSRFKLCSDIVMGQSPDGNSIKSDVGRYPFMQGNAEFTDKFPNPKLYCDIPAKLSRVGDILLSVRAPVGAINCSDRVYGIGRGLCSIKPTGVHPDFFRFYLLKSQDDFPIISNGSTFSAITTADLRNFPIVLPPLPEQKRIADFLDSKCAKIDEILDKTRASIEEYKKLKQAIITEAVTKGVRGKRPMKPSGIEWIGEIPEEWEVERLKDIFLFGKGLPITKADLVDEGAPVISYGQIHAKNNTGVSIQSELIRHVDNGYLETNRDSVAHQGDFIFADTSEDLDGCGNCVYLDDMESIFAGYHTIIFFSKGRKTNKYLAYLFQSDAWRKQIRSRVTGVKIFSISRKILAIATVIEPQADEQREIADYLDQKCGVLNSLISKKERFLAAMEGYRKSLIYEYVTGKKEVAS